MQRLGAIVATLVLVGCSHQAQTKPAAGPEPWFQRIRAVSGDGLAQCRLLEPVETLIEVEKLVPSVEREDYLQTRRIAFYDFETKVLAAGGNAVRIDVFSERVEVGNPRFALDAIHLAGRAVVCP